MNNDHFGMGTLFKAFNLSPFNNPVAMVVDHDVMFSNLSCGFSEDLHIFHLSILVCRQKGNGL
jgi:hypothetical protein